MNWLHLISYFFGGMTVANSVPHFVSGMMGRPFQSPFAKPAGEGLSSSTVNVVWGLFNLVLSWQLLLRVGNFQLRYAPHALALLAGMLFLGILMSRHFGKFHGGNLPA